MIALACLSLVAACWAMWPAEPSKRGKTFLDGTEVPRRLGGRTWLRRGASLAGLLGAVTLVAPRTLVWVLPALVASVTISWLIAQANAEKARRSASDEVVQVCQAVAAQLRSGDIPARALARVAVDSPLLQPVAATQAIGGSVPAALQALAARPGCGGLASLARSWQLCQITGAPIAQAASRVAEGMREDAAAARMVAAELAAPRATGRMLAALPALGIGLGFVSGGDPLDFLCGTLIGQACFAGAICLVSAGLVWTTLLGRVPEMEEERR